MTQCYLPPGTGIVAGAIMRRLDEPGGDSLRGRRASRPTVEGRRVAGPAPLPCGTGFEPLRGTALGGDDPRPACESVDPELFHDPAYRREAKRACLACPVRESCLRDALESDERFGVWGGLDPAERRRVTHGGRRG